MATTFGKELRKLRIDKDENIHDMAKKLGISISYLSAIEAGSRNIPSDMVDKMVSFIKSELILNGGDVFEIPIKIFDVMTSEDKAYNDMIAMTDRANLNSDLIAEYMQYRFHEYDFVGKLAAYVNHSSLNLKNTENLKYVIFMMEDAIKSAMAAVAKNPKSKDKEREILYKKVMLLKRAVRA